MKPTHEADDMKPTNPPRDLSRFVNEPWQQARSAGQPQSGESVARDLQLAVRSAEIEKLKRLRLNQAPQSDGTPPRAGRRAKAGTR